MLNNDFDVENSLVDIIGDRDVLMEHDKSKFSI